MKVLKMACGSCRGDGRESPLKYTSQVEEVIRTRGFFVPVNGMRFFDEFVGEAFETRLKERLCAEMHHAMSSQAERDWEQIDFTGADSAWR